MQGEAGRAARFPESLLTPHPSPAVHRTDSAPVGATSKRRPCSVSRCVDPRVGSNQMARSDLLALRQAPRAASPRRRKRAGLCQLPIQSSHGVDAGCGPAASVSSSRLAPSVASRYRDMPRLWKTCKRAPVGRELVEAPSCALGSPSSALPTL